MMNGRLLSFYQLTVIVDLAVRPVEELKFSALLVGR